MFRYKAKPVNGELSDDVREEKKEGNSAKCHMATCSRKEIQPRVFTVCTIGLSTLIVLIVGKGEFVGGITVSPIPSAKLTRNRKGVQLWVESMGHSERDHSLLGHLVPYVPGFECQLVTPTTPISEWQSNW